MTLTDYKIPIIVGRNDVPTTAETQPNHPNGSFVIKQFNDLIDNELTAMQNASGGGSTAKTPLTADLYIDTTATTNGNGTEANPYNNVASVIDRLNNSIIDLSNNDFYLFLLADTDLGDLNITADNTTNISYVDQPFVPYHLTIEGAFTLTVTTISSSLPLKISSDVILTDLTAIRNSRVTIDSQELINGYTFANSTVTLNDCTFVTSQIASDNCNLTFNTCSSTRSGSDDHFVLTGSYNNVSFNNCSFSDFSGRFFDVAYSNVVIKDSSFDYNVVDDFYKFDSQSGSIIANNITITAINQFDGDTPQPQLLQTMLLAPFRVIDGILYNSNTTFDQNVISNQVAKITVTNINATSKKLTFYDRLGTSLGFVNTTI